MKPEKITFSTKHYQKIASSLTRLAEHLYLLLVNKFMGQQNGKDASRGAPPGGRRIPINNPRTAGTTGMRTQAVNDTLVAPRATTQHAEPQADDTAGVDPRRDPAATQSPTRSAPSNTSAPACTVPPAPVVIRYKNTDAKQLIDRKVPIEVLIQDQQDASNQHWTRLPMSRSDDNYFVIVNLAPGEHRFRFSLPDRGTMVDPTQPTVIDNGAAGGGVSEPANVVQVSADIMTTKDDDDLIDDGAGWGHVETQFEETRKYPPMLPPHLRYTPLNTPPTQVRCQHDGSLNVATSTLEAEHLPLPLSVTINHVYFQKREDHVVSGMTTRYCNKFTTIAYYRSIVDSGSGTSSLGAASADGVVLPGGDDGLGSGNSTAPVAIQ